MTHDGTATFVEKHRTPDTGEALSSPTLPSELVAQAAQRLSYAAFLYAVAYSLAYLPNRLIQPAGMPPPVMDIVAAAFVLGSVALALAVRRLDLPPERVVDLGLLYEVAGAVGIEIGVLWWSAWGWFMHAVYGLAVVPGRTAAAGILRRTALGLARRVT